MTLKQASAFSLAKAKTIQLVSHRFSLFFTSWNLGSGPAVVRAFPSFLCCGMWHLEVYTLNSYLQSAFILSQWLRSVCVDAWGTAFKSCGTQTLSQHSGCSDVTASLCPPPSCVSFLGTSLFVLPREQSFFFCFILRFRNFGSMWLLSCDLCPGLGALYCLSFTCPFLAPSVLGCSLEVLQLVPYALHFFLLMVSALFLGPDLLNQ